MNLKCVGLYALVVTLVGVGAVQAQYSGGMPGAGGPGAGAPGSLPPPPGPDGLAPPMSNGPLPGPGNGAAAGAYPSGLSPWIL
ncbi:MAG TPA: hypothetical protein VFA26_14355, partial [Gemmataceae bacterium]|nr:hypothetical protein [Gemmataceae bacterium]